MSILRDTVLQFIHFAQSTSVNSNKS